MDSWYTHRNITRTTNSGEYKVQATSNSYITLTPGKTYTFSAYIKTTGMSGTGTGAGIAIGLNGGGVVSASETIKKNSDWTRIETTYTHPAGSTNNTA